MNPILNLVAKPMPDVDTDALRHECSACRLRDRCLPMGLNESDTKILSEIIGHRYHVRRGEYLYRMNDPFTTLYAIQLGGFKTLQIDSNGTEHIVGFQMAGELLGMDAINTRRHNYDSLALEDSEVCTIPFDRLEFLFTKVPSLMHNFQRMMSQEIMRNQSRMLLFGNMRADQRMAAFLVNLSSRYAAQGYSSLRFHLRMSREDIGNYLALSIESISRLLTGFHRQGLLKVVRRELEIIDPMALKKLALGGARAKDLAHAQIPPRTSIGAVNSIA